MQFTLHTMEEERTHAEESQESIHSPEMNAPEGDRARKSKQFHGIPTVGPISNEDEHGFTIFKASKLLTIPTSEKLATTLNITNDTAFLEFWVGLGVYEA